VRVRWQAREKKAGVILNDPVNVIAVEIRPIRLRNPCQWLSG